MVKQNIVFVETPAVFRKLQRFLAENQIDIYGFGCFDAPEFANFRMVCDDPEKADQIMARTDVAPRMAGDSGGSSGWDRRPGQTFKCHGRQQRKPSLHLHLLPQRPESSGSDHAL